MVSGDKFADAVLDTQGGNMSIVDKVARDAGFFHNRHHDLRMIRRLVQKYQHR